MTEVYSKALANIEASDDSEFGPNGGFHAILSTPSMDRDGDKLDRNGWQPLVDRYPLDMDHGMTVEDTIGSFEPYFEGDEMRMRAYFASTEKAQMVRTLVNEGHIRSVSVAFMTDKSKKDGEPRRELLNAGVVAIPSNRDAVIQCSKSARAAVLVDRGIMSPEEAKAALLLTESQEEATEADKKAAATNVGGGGDSGALTQAIHDASVHMGATCIPLVSDMDNTGASDGANKSADEVDVKSQKLELEVPDDLDLEQFKAALQEVLNPQPKEESPADSPAEAAAASDEEPAPAVEAAEEAADEPEVVDPDKQANEMLLSLFAAQNL